MSKLNNRAIRKRIKDFIILSLGDEFNIRLTKKTYPEILDFFNIQGEANNASQFYGLMNTFLKKRKVRLQKRLAKKEKKRQAILKKKRHYNTTITFEVWTPREVNKEVIWVQSDEVVVIKNKTPITFDPEKKRSHFNKNYNEIPAILEKFPEILWTGKVQKRYARLLQDGGKDIDEIIKPSPPTIATIINISNVLIEGDNNVKLEDIKMFHAGFNIATQYQSTKYIDSGNNQCVPELLHKRYHQYKPKTLKEVDNVVEYLRDPLDYGDNNRINEGFSSNDIKRFCDYFKIPMYALDISEECFLTNVMNKPSGWKSKKLPALCFIMANTHMYLCDNKTFVKSISHRVSSVKSHTGMMKEFQSSQRLKQVAELTNATIIETDNLNNQLTKLMTENNTLYKASGYGGKLTRIDAGEKTIYCNPDLSVIRQFCKDTETPFTNQTITQVFNEAFKKIHPLHKKSLMNTRAFNAFRKHGGIIKKLQPFNPDNEYGLKVDINKAYPYALNMNKWRYKVYSITDEIELYDGIMTDGFYYVKLDETVFPYKNDGWFSDGFLKWYKDQGFDFTVKYQYKTADTLPADYFNEFYEQVLASNIPVKRFNEFIGGLGKTNIKTQKVVYDSDKNTIINYYFGKDENGNTVKDMMDNDFSISCDTINDKLVYKLTMTNEIIQLCNDMPIYNQILENNYINVYNVIKSYEGKTVCAIHTDSVQFKSDNEFEAVINSDKIGGLKNETPLEINQNQIISSSHRLNSYDELQVNFKKFKTYYEKDIGNTEDLISWLYDAPSAMIVGDAGCGKTYLINRLKERLDEEDKKYIALAYTNKASQLINGQTIHKCFGLGIGDDIKIDSRLVQKLKGKEYLFIDEISMIGKDILAVLATIRKKYQHLKIICCGDFKQLPPVGEGIYENSSVWLDICKRRKLILNIPKRNEDKAFHTNAVKVFNTGIINKYDYGDFDIDECKKHITYTNKMRCEINHQMMQKNKPSDAPMIEKHQDNDYGQNTYIYQGLPVMCIKNNKDMSFVNGCEFTIVSYDNDKISCDDLEIPYEVFSEYFVPSYAITYYKCQGATFDEKFAIHQTTHPYVCNHALYTAVTRCTNKKNILII